MHTGQVLASLLPLSSDQNIEQRSLQPQPPAPPFETAEEFDFENFRDLSSRTSTNVYPPEEQAAAGETNLQQQQQDKRHKIQTFPLPPPQPSSMLPLEYHNYPVVVSQMPQALAALYPTPVTATPPPPPVTEEVPLYNDQLSASLPPLPSGPER